ncbi:hypothetical protein TNIN_418641 [Trichonephila inaurata madagascariensis]|uniref:Uncharacterized protein n=1 Tax=Trichonephila inaurata madagascariensis TaxID=2747483 RepID=A0A8X6ITT2_9ARAC|nr:hypothetical protein TNIN_418641 [Trichonephila inaurata madagascariensis]
MRLLGLQRVACIDIELNLNRMNYLPVFTVAMATARDLKDESGHPQFQLDREFLKEKLRVKPIEETDHLPLLYGLVSYFSKENKPSNSTVTPAEKS